METRVKIEQAYEDCAGRMLKRIDAGLKMRHRGWDMKFYILLENIECRRDRRDIERLHLELSGLVDAYCEEAEKYPAVYKG